MDKLFQSLRADCENCFGLCCVSLYFLKTEGFPINKEPGISCPNLLSNFKCAIHEDLRKKGLKGCASFDCFGAGAKIAQQTFKGADWMNHPENTNKIFDTFQVMRQLHEILWYLNQAAVKMNMADRKSLFPMIDKIEKLTKLEADKLLVLDVSACRADANIFLLKVKNDMKSHLLKNEKDETGKRKIKHQLDLMGKDLRKMDLRGADFRGAYLMAANLSGTNLKGADFIGGRFERH